METLPREGWDAIEAHERKQPLDVESWEMIFAISATDKVGEDSLPLNSWGVDGFYGQSGDLLWQDDGYPVTLEKPYLLAARRNLPDGDWSKPVLLFCLSPGLSDSKQ